MTVRFGNSYSKTRRKEHGTMFDDTHQTSQHLHLVSANAAARCVTSQATMANVDKTKNKDFNRAIAFAHPIVSCLSLSMFAHLLTN